MSFDWKEYLYLAYSLASQQDPHIPLPAEEARLRSSISRAYYASFIVARNYLRDIKKICIPRKEAHKFVIEHYSTSGDLTASQIGVKLGRLRADRERVDYDDSIKLRLKPTASFHLMNACSVITLVESLPHQIR